LHLPFSCWRCRLNTPGWGGMAAVASETSRMGAVFGETMLSSSAEPANTKTAHVAIIVCSKVHVAFVKLFGRILFMATMIARIGLVTHTGTSNDAGSPPDQMSRRPDRKLVLVALVTHFPSLSASRLSSCQAVIYLAIWQLHAGSWRLASVQRSSSKARTLDSFDSYRRQNLDTFDCKRLTRLKLFLQGKFVTALLRQRATAKRQKVAV
jgi:hypothetical protein